jgi:hypothetical protein
MRESEHIENPSREEDRAGRRSARRIAIQRAAIAALSALGCASIGGNAADDAYKELTRTNESAREKLAFGMSKAEAAAIMGEAGVRPPWANDRGIGPQIVRNPFDTLHIESPEGEEYEIHRYAVGLYGEPRCPFVHGDAVLIPLIFLEGKLVGWRWSYMESVLQRRLREEEQAWSAEGFCGPAS